MSQDNDHIRIWVDIENGADNIEVRVRPKMLIKDFIAFLMRECQLVSGTYDLAVREAEDNLRVLQPSRTLGQEEVGHEARVRLYRRADGSKTDIDRQISENQRVYLTDSRRSTAQIKVTTERIITLQWHPAIIGRVDENPNNNHLLAVDLSRMPNAGKISRRHACIFYRGGHYYLYHLSQKSKTFLNEERLQHGQAYTLHGGDKIRLGDSGVVLEFMVRDG